MVAMSRGVKIELRFRVNRTMLRTPDCQVVLIENLESLDWGLEAFIHSQPNATLQATQVPIFENVISKPHVLRISRIRLGEEVFFPSGTVPPSPKAPDLTLKLEKGVEVFLTFSRIPTLAPWDRISLTVCGSPEPQGLDPQGLFDRIDK